MLSRKALSVSLGLFCRKRNNDVSWGKEGVRGEIKCLIILIVFLVSIRINTYF